MVRIEAMANYLFQKLEIGDLFISANRILKEGSSLKFILEKISESEAVYRDKSCEWICE